MGTCDHTCDKTCEYSPQKCTDFIRINSITSIRMNRATPKLRRDAVCFLDTIFKGWFVYSQTPNEISSIRIRGREKSFQDNKIELNDVHYFASIYMELESICSNSHKLLTNREFVLNWKIIRLMRAFFRMYLLWCND